MNATEIIAKHLVKKEDDVLEIDTRCMLCNKEIKQGIKKNKIMSAKFTDYDECKNITSGYVCIECGTCIKERDLRTHNILADDKSLYLFKKQELEEYVFNIDKYVSGEFVIAMTTSFKKHNSFRCRVNNDTRRFYIRWEDRELLFNVDEMKDLYQILNEMYLFFNKDEMLAGNYSIMKIKEFGLKRFEEVEQVIKRHRKTHQLDLLVYMLDSEKRNEFVKERIEDAKRKEKEKKAIEKFKKEEMEGQISIFG